MQMCVCARLGFFTFFLFFLLVRSTCISYRIGLHHPRRNIPLLEQIPLQPSVLPEVPDYMFCRAKRFYMEPLRFYCSAGKIHLAETQMPDKLFTFIRQILLKLESFDFASEVTTICLPIHPWAFIMTKI